MASGALLTILFTDLVGATEMHAHLGDDSAQELIAGHTTRLRTLVEANDGRVVKCIGDSVMATFRSPRRALACAAAIQQGELADAQALSVRIGLSAGEVIERDDDVHGLAVATAARIAGLADGGEVLAADLVRQLAGADPSLRYVDRGLVDLLGVPEAVRIVALDWEGSGPQRRVKRRALASEALPESSRRRRSVLAAGLIGRESPFTDPTPSQYDGFQCTGLPGTPSCGVHAVGTSTWSGGTFTADEHYELAGAPTTDGKFTYAGAAYLTGAIEGCGRGSFIIETDDGYIDFAATDVNDNLEGGVGGSAPGFNHWKLRAGSGTGGLAGLVSGGGEVNWRYYHQGGSGLGGPEGIGVLTGTITCEVPRAPAPARPTETRAVDNPRAATATASAAGPPTVAVLAATSERTGEMPRTGGSAAAAFAGAALLGAGLVARRTSRA